MKSFSLRPLQKEGLMFMHDKKRVNIFASMGSGKTLMTLSYLLYKHNTNGDVFPAVIFAPKYVANSVWSAELDAYKVFSGVSYSVVTGSASQRDKALSKKADIYIINYENAEWLIERRDTFNTVVCDESTKIKNHRWNIANGRKSYDRSGTKYAGAVVSLAFKAQYWVNLTGTPNPNGYIDLWGQCFPIDMGLALGLSFSSFRREYCELINPEHPMYGYKVCKPYTKTILDKISRYSLVLDAEKYYGVGEPKILIHNVGLPDNLMSKYQKLKKQFVVDLNNGEAITVMSAGAKSMKCRQFASGAVLNENNEWVRIHDYKIDALRDLADQCYNENLLVVCYFRWEAEAIAKAIKGAVVFKSKQDIDDWNAGKIKMLLLNAQSAGHGLNLQHGGRRIVFFSMDFNLEYHNQVCERVGSMRQFQSGYNRDVYRHYLIAQGTIDEAIYKVICEKKKVSAALYEYLSSSS